MMSLSKGSFSCTSEFLSSSYSSHLSKWSYSLINVAVITYWEENVNLHCKKHSSFTRESIPTFCYNYCRANNNNNNSWRKLIYECLKIKCNTTLVEERSTNLLPNRFPCSIHIQILGWVLSWYICLISQ